MDNQYLTFQKIVTITASIFVGMLVTLPMTSEQSGANGSLILIIGALAGGMVGYKQRESRFFMYLALLCVLVLSTLLFFQMTGS